MLQQKIEDVRDIALKLDEIKTYCPEDYFYLKGWIHCLLQKEKMSILISTDEEVKGSLALTNKKIEKRIG